VKKILKAVVCDSSKTF